MGLRPCDFEGMTPAEFLYAYLGWARMRREQEKAGWERTRWETWILTSIQLEPKDRRDMTSMFPLPWDSETETQQKKSNDLLTDEERRERVNEMLRCVDAQK